MSKSFGTLLKVLLSVSLAGVILYFVFRKVDAAEFYRKLKEVNYGWVVLTMVISFFTYFLRAYRWKLLIHPLGYRPTSLRMFLALMSGYLANLVIPRIGEITRCGVLFKSDEVPVSSSFGTVITERIVDLISLIIILLLTLAIQSEQLLAFMKQTVNLDLNWGLILTLTVLTMLIGTYFFVRFIYPSRTKVGEFSRGVIQGLTSLRQVELGKFLLATLGIWMVYFFMSYWMVFALTETSHLPWQVGFAILSAGVIAFALPVQSGFGTFHALVAAMLALYGIDQTTGVFFASLLHTSQLLAILFFGLFAVVISFFIKRNVDREKNSTARAGH